MLVIRMQRTGRKGHAQFRVVVQDKRRTPSSEKASFYLEHGAQPSPRVVRLLKSEGVKLPKWVNVHEKQTGKTKNIEKLRKNRPAEPEEAQAEAEKTPEEAAPEPAKEEDKADEASKEEATKEEAPDKEETSKEEKPAK
jgi:small subunit ribosomal protein S16